ncbi:uncharacterized protein BDR25DRAFT_230821 [Lindgomyces ingoldianus]|uniref:Uncharacterized protein n=1 Tax=Lindgomyces ingoldianus TaxID=673940 RepID=A0ACB6QPY7_9PLEO|nr:uncharacterized protein BDR25DRAFT_230821 [Lindgomyces ingoldianus]KAF2468945.1 hypothetical protein BDR25DRAFT_230821 [Lindgomyces ingoldianus]
MKKTPRVGGIPAGPTAYNVQLSATKTPGFTHVEGLKQESAEIVSDLLMLNNAKYHTLFNEVGLHNHMVHHLLSLWALGASPSQIKSAYDLNKKYQLPQYHHSASLSLKLKDPEFFQQCLYKPEFYSNYLEYFQEEIAERGTEDVVREYVFAGDARADDLLGRMYSVGFEHPILHLGFALEFAQPCLVAESLAAASIHDDWPIPIITPIESHLKSNPNTPHSSMFKVIRALHSDPIISSAVKPSDPANRVTDGLMKRAAKELVPILARWRVDPTTQDIAVKTAEMAHMSVYMAACAQNPKKVPAIDFFMMHSVNLSVFYPTFMRLEWLSLEERARLLTWKGWMDAVLYAACGCPALYLERVQGYKAKRPGDWSSIITRAVTYPDDGHTSKLIRALLNAQNLSLPYFSPRRPEFPLMKEDFLKIAHMTMDSVERMNDPGYRIPEEQQKMYVEKLGMDEEVVKVVVRWVRWCGVEGAWDNIEDLEEGERAKL